jgi:Ca2+-transporting ATPase
MNTDLKTGLSSADAARRLRLDGFNELPSSERRGVVRIVGDVLRQPMFALLIAGGVVYLMLGDRLESILLLIFACFSVFITIVPEARSERVLETLRNLASPRAWVIRDGRKLQVPGREVVTGDVIVVGEGDRVAADATLFAAHDVLVDESLLTGESVPVRKSSMSVNESDGGSEAVPGGDDLPFVYAGTLVVRGIGRALVSATGANSEMGAIGRHLASIDTEQPHLQRQIAWLVRDYAIAGVLAGVIAFLLFGVLRGSWLEAMLGGIALGMSLLPEEFPLVMTVFMAMGAWRISRARVLTRRAAAIEALGATTVLCTDKTGTLTQNRMSVVFMSTPGGAWEPSAASGLAPPLRELLGIALAASATDPTDPMDLAVHALARQMAGSTPADAAAPVALKSYGLRQDLLAVGHVVPEPSGEGLRACVKGALEAIEELCHLPAARLEQIRAQADELAERGVRVLGVARSSLMTAPADAPLPESLRGFDFEFMGLVGFADPLREGVKAAVEECRSAGIRVVMITGDYPATARAIGLQAGIDASAVISGDELEAMTDAQLNARIASTSLFARIRPAQKLRIVQSLKADGAVVAMTGDGVNDAPAIKAAHIGIAMGARGTDVAREASSIVLLDDDFASIVRTIRLGRRIYDNLRKAIEYIVAVHIPIAGLALLPLLLGLPLILTPIHIAFLEMIIDPACSMVFEAEGEEPNVMRRPPRDPGSPLLLRRRLMWALLQGLLALVILAGVLVGTSRAGASEADLRTLVFVSLVVINLELILVNRSFDCSWWQAVTRPNTALWLLAGGVIAVLALAVYWQPLQALFKFGTLHGHDVLAVAGIGLISLIVLESLKMRLFRH